MNLVYIGVSAQDLNFLFTHGFHIAETTQPSQVVRYVKPGCTIALYASGKLLVQCKEESLSTYERLFSSFTLKQAKKSTASSSPSKDYDALSVFGSDETLKGDTFGGLVVSGFNYTPDLKTELQALGVKDSKLLTDDAISRIAEELEARFASRCITIELNPEMYNGELKDKNITRLLNELHQTIATHRDKGQLHLVDAYPGCKVGDEAVTQAEGKSLAVAAASIVARAKAIKQFERLSAQAGFQLPKGSTHVAAALQEILQRNLPMQVFAKLHFKNVQKVLEEGKDAS